MWGSKLKSRILLFTSLPAGAIHVFAIPPAILVCNTQHYFLYIFWFFSNLISNVPAPVFGSAPSACMSQSGTSISKEKASAGASLNCGRGSFLGSLWTAKFVVAFKPTSKSTKLRMARERLAMLMWASQLSGNKSVLKLPQEQWLSSFEAWRDAPKTKSVNPRPLITRVL